MPRASSHWRKSLRAARTRRSASAIDLTLVGFGHVGRRFARLLEERRDVLARDHGLTTRIVGIATRRHGTAFDPRGLDVGKALALVESGGRLEALHDRRSGPPPRTGVALIARHARLGDRQIPRVIVETTVLDVRRGRPAIDHVRAGLRSGAHVITTNKGPVAIAYRSLRALAESVGRAFLFEGAVMDGIPIFNLVRRTLPAVRIEGFRGVVNSTTNHMLTAMEAGRPFDESLAAMQAAGIAEADPSLDVDGWDAAAKAAALVNVLMDGRMTPARVDRTGIGPETAEAVRAAAARGCRVKLVACASRRGSRIEARVAPEELPATDLLAGLGGQANALVLETDLLGELAIVQLRGSLTETAYALLSDLVEVGRLRRAPRATPRRRIRRRRTGPS
jgi:homoserine dehydrogenase